MRPGKPDSFWRVSRSEPVFFRHDARTSVRADFTEDDLSALWPAGDGWRLKERRAGLFSHRFVAQRTGEGKF